MRKIGVPHLPSGDSNQSEGNQPGGSRHLAALPAHPGLVLRPLVLAITIAIVVSALLTALPGQDVAAQPVQSFSALVPQADANQPTDNLDLNAAFVVQFTKPMNAGSVAGALTITPKIDLKYRWDATFQQLAILPSPYWAPDTDYTVDISTAASDQEGLGLDRPIRGSFRSGPLTAGQIRATTMLNGLASPKTAFQVTFTRPVKLATVLLRFKIDPAVAVSVLGDDPTDRASMVFTMTPKQMLDTNSIYNVSMAGDGADTFGAPLAPVNALKVLTLPTPAVIRFAPQGGSVTNDGHQPVSVQFSVPMDQPATNAAISVTVDGRAVSGTPNWTDDGTTYTLTPKYGFNSGDTVLVSVSKTAKSAGGVNLAADVSSSFAVKIRGSSGGIRIPFTYEPVTGSPWYGSETYYLALMNCTRTGGWVTSSGSCSSETHHTLPAQGKLALDAGISNTVSRPYAKYMADNVLLNHYLIGDPHYRLCNWGGYCGSSWGENIASPGSTGQAGMISIEVFYQSEYNLRRPNHYSNIMSPYFHRCGIGVWYSNSVRVSIDFYG